MAGIDVELERRVGRLVETGVGGLLEKGDGLADVVVISRIDFLGRVLVLFASLGHRCLL
jgi:hypothetical protein